MPLDRSQIRRDRSEISRRVREVGSEEGKEENEGGEWVCVTRCRDKCGSP